MPQLTSGGGSGEEAAILSELPLWSEQCQALLSKVALAAETRKDRHLILRDDERPSTCRSLRLGSRERQAADTIAVG